MDTETQKSDGQTTVRISSETKKRVQRIARKMADRQDRRVAEIEVAERILIEGLPRLEKELGL